MEGRNLGGMELGEHGKSRFGDSGLEVLMGHNDE